jgi:4-hydroxyacetophenone monooxygenase
MTIALAEQQMLTQAIAIANVPTLLPLLVQMTGETHWLDAPYGVRREAGLGDNDTGGLPPAQQQAIRDAALEAILAWRCGRRLAIEQPSEELLVRMLSAAMGERVPQEYGEFTAAQLGQTPFLQHQPFDLPNGFHVLVIGAGVSGLCAAVNLHKAGVPFTVIERNPTVGGVWWENRYPGAGVDTPNHLYAFSFANYDWKNYFCLRDDLHGYLEKICDDFDVRKHIRFDTEVEQISYDASTQTWTAIVHGADGAAQTLSANIVISGAGLFNPPVEPKIAGLDSWTGERWHTARWPQDASLDGKRVAIIGNGASCMQIGPEIQHEVQSLSIFQRSNHWAAPFEQFRKEVPEPIRYLFKAVPLYRQWYRVRLGWTFNDKVHPTLQKDPEWDQPQRSLNAANDGHRAYFTRHLINELGDKAQGLLDKVLPTYPPFGKRMLMDNGWYRMLRNPKVALIDNPIARIDGDKVICADGSEHAADVLVLATGFDVLRLVNTYTTIGRSGQTLRDAWDDDNAQAYLGTVVPDFPNYFVLYGPNLQPGHGGSLIFVIEMQVRYIMDVIGKMCAQNLGAVEVEPAVHRQFNDEVDARHENMVWSHPGMSTYYRNARGRIVINSPFRNVDWYNFSKSANLDEFIVEPRVHNTAAQ